MLFKKHGIIYDDLWRGNAEVNNAIIHCFCRLRNKGRKKNYIMSQYTGILQICREHTWKVPRLSSKSASIDQTFKDLYTLFWTGSDESKYSAFLDGMAVAFYIETIKSKYITTMSTKYLYKIYNCICTFNVKYKRNVWQYCCSFQSRH